jgi:hypothetical protein
MGPRHEEYQSHPTLDLRFGFLTSAHICTPPTPGGPILVRFLCWPSHMGTSAQERIMLCEAYFHWCNPNHGEPSVSSVVLTLVVTSALHPAGTP